jgi:hypothetical protein
MDKEEAIGQYVRKIEHGILMGTIIYGADCELARALEL